MQETGVGIDELNEKSVLHLKHAVGHERQVTIVGDNYYCLAEFVAQVEKQLVYVFLGAAVKIAGGLVGEYHGRTVDDGPGDGDALLFAS